MKRNNNELLKILEEKFLNGSISDEELKLYSRWYNWKQGRKVEIQEDIAPSYDVHKNKLFGKILDELGESGESFRQYYRHFQQKASLTKYIFKYGIAAALLSIIIITAFLLIPTKKIDKKNFQDIEPGRSGLVLTLDDGKQIMLDSVKDGLISYRNGVKIFKKNGHIEYEGTGLKDLYNTATTNVGRQYQIVLPDNSIVWLNSLSELIYPISFSGNQRVVKLKGEGYFEIKHQYPNTPFIVETANKQIKVLGTHFNINSYSDEPNVIATLLEGSVEMASGRNNTVIHPNQAAVGMRNGNDITVKNVVAEESVMWLHQVFNFENLTLEEIMKKIQRWYGVAVLYQTGVNKNATYAGVTPMNQNLSEVLKVLEFSGIHFIWENNKITILQ